MPKERSEWVQQAQVERPRARGLQEAEVLPGMAMDLRELPRGLGLARILTLQALHAARNAGYKLSVLHSTPMAVGLYEKVGFRAIAPFRVFAPPQAVHV
jgi:GNAT superfamily N-acetyltransferase